MGTLRFVLTLFLIFVIGLMEQIQSQSFITNSGNVEFISTAPLLTFKGTSNHLNGLIDLESGKVDFFVDLNTLNTGNRRRDRDMRKVYLETEKYPFAEFTGKITQDIDPNFNGEIPVTVQGHFKMRGIEHPLSVEGVIRKTDVGIHVQASWEILLRDFNIDRPRVVFYELSDVQTVNIDVTLSPEI